MSDIRNGIVHVEISDQGQLAKAEKLLAGIPNGINQAVKSAMSRAVSHLRTNSAKAIRERYDITAANIRTNENVTIRYEYHEGVRAYIHFAGEKIPLYRFGGASPGAPTPLKDRWVKVMGMWFHPGAPAHGHVLNSTAPALFEHAFVARMKSGHVGIFESIYWRHGDMGFDKGKLFEIKGPSVPTMLGQDEVKERLGEQTAEKFQERLPHEVIRLLNGWGG